jgi:hypothetical protein
VPGSLKVGECSRGCGGFSYFNVITKNRFVQWVKVFKKKNKVDVHFDRDLLYSLEKNNEDMTRPEKHI